MEVDELVGAGWGGTHGSGVAPGVCRMSSASSCLDSQREA